MQNVECDCGPGGGLCRQGIPDDTQEGFPMESMKQLEGSSFPAKIVSEQVLSLLVYKFSDGSKKQLHIHQ